MTSDGVAPNDVKVEAITKILPPKDVSTLRSFLGLVNCYQNFVKNHSTVLKSLNNLLKRDVEWKWEEEHHKAFDEIKHILATKPMLKRPNFDRVFKLYTDWSKIGIGALLAQEDDAGVEHVVAYASRSNNQAKVTIPRTMVSALLRFGQSYISGRIFMALNLN